jgi:D-beta-D-heptose 7-phosphate kinase/D-beta-D-heptose 1-phosphate adenosyltransferase
MSSAVKSLVRISIRVLELEALVVTRGSEGMSLFENTEGVLHRVDVPTTARSVYDVTGAGDIAIANFAAAIAARSDCTTAVGLANLCAGITVGKRGTACVSLEELERSIAEGAGSSRPAISTGEVSSAEDHARPLARTL